MSRINEMARSGSFHLPKLHRRHKTWLSALFTAVLLTAVWLGSSLLGNDNLSISLNSRNLPPSLAHPFGTDWLGRDMLTRTLKGLVLSIKTGMLAGAVSVIIAALLGLLAATMGKITDRLITWLIDLFLSVPHLVTLILIAFVMGGGAKGVIVGVALTHWPSLSRVIRAEVMNLRTAEYVQVSRRLGKSRWWIGTRHILPHLLPQLLIGLLLIFPHAILHEAGVTFIGMGLSPHEPAIGIILSESMRYLSTGMWWLAVFPGLSLLIIVIAFGRLGENLRLLADPNRAHE
ncbi:ABC transporter permease [Paenibacillus radicis (ex Xue et al. 2023)]|uniref:ABC transporter permease n=1 Tax=Paenibacillus radicis (ex Xue et al. 2023) TaxID=2972489 RepID=A0ABT1YEC6_9BACL|nr:ABC transporter permease [Paenibacillus radicis (ex Xue et al. 2023)]MCR8631539.1 ABC transporter permease [Paenibacillus radicis (ex Xue et al. 2023)]